MSTSTETATSSAVAICAPDAERIYQRGFEKLVEDEPKRASELFGIVERSCPVHPLASEMRRLADARVRMFGPEEVTEVETEPGVERPSLLAWGELLVFQTLHGIAQGLLICVAANCDDPRALALSGFAGASLGAGLSIIGFKKIRSGQASAIDSGTGWGIWNAVALSVLTEPDDNVGPAMISGVMLGGTLAGVGAALLLEPRNGAVSFANSTGIWLGVTTLWILLAGEADFEDTIIPIELAVTNVGLIGGALASQYLDISRGRVLLIDAGGIVGALLGLGVAALINTDFPPSLFGPLAAVGTVGGLIGTFFLTIPLDEPDEEEEDDSAWWIAPSAGGFVAGATF